MHSIIDRIPLNLPMDIQMKTKFTTDLIAYSPQICNEQNTYKIKPNISCKIILY